MTTLNEMIEIIKAENPTLQVGDDEIGYRNLESKEYDAQIKTWAEARLKEENDAATNEADKAALLVKLGITADEAKLLLS